MIEVIEAFYAIGEPDGALTEGDANNPSANTEDDDIRADGDPDTDGQQGLNHYWVVEGSRRR